MIVCENVNICLKCCSMCVKRVCVYDKAYCISYFSMSVRESIHGCYCRYVCKQICIGLSEREYTKCSCTELSFWKGSLVKPTIGVNHPV